MFAASWLRIAISVSLIRYARIFPAGLVSTGVIFVLFMNPKSKKRFFISGAQFMLFIVPILSNFNSIYVIFFTPTYSIFF